jgi:hypothetical protein
MNAENTKKLITDFPILYAGARKPPTENLMCFGFSCGDGWFELIYELSQKITELDPNCEAMQVKEKFGTLRFYTGATTNEVFELIEEYENKSEKVCEDCGSTEDVRPPENPYAWITNLCKKCRSSNDNI